MNETISNQLNDLQKCMELLIDKVTEKPIEAISSLKELEVLETSCICLDERKNHVIHGNNGQLNLISDIVLNLYKIISKDIINFEKQIIDLTNENKQLKFQINELKQSKPLTLDELKDFCKTTNVKLEFTKPIEIRRKPY